ncbi:MAG: L,D-transpeptidase family protein [Deltaproteobacteria bacterium]|nr:L,D-transpeptidase family protein [Deltaproteobacteria bacterium]
MAEETQRRAGHPKGALTVLACGVWWVLGPSACADARSEGGSAGPPSAASSSMPATLVGSAPSTASAAVPDAGAGDQPAGDRPPAADAWPPRPAPSDQTGDRIYSKVRHLWIRPAVHSRAWLGYLSLGDSVRVKDGNAEQAYVTKGDSENCQKWYAVEPEGFACTGRRATLDAQDEEIVELRRTRADPTSPWPYHYGESLGVPVYNELPSKDAQGRREPGLEAYLDKVAQAQAAGSEEDRKAIDKRFFGMTFSATGKGPPKLLELGPGGRTLSTRVVRGSTIAYTDSFDLEGRPFLLTWDRGIAPLDKVRPYPESPFQGVILGGDHRLPIAFFRGEDRPQYRRTGAGDFEPTGNHFKRLSWIELTGTTAKQDGETYEQTTKPDLWCARADAAIVRAVDEPPARIAQRDEGRRTWLDISILGGTLVAYENRRPVYATLISPGRGGIPRRGVPTLDTASTPTGQFPVVGKFLTATMVSGSISDLVHAEVQYTQNFDGPYALHGAYWHDRFGEKKSGGCVNLSPIDSMRIFAWTEPALPLGWHGLRTATFGHKTLLQLHR